MRELVRLTAVKGLSTKAVLLHLADVVRDDNRQFWQSQGHIADSISTDRKTVRRQLDKLVNQGLIQRVGERPGAGRSVDIYEICVPALMRLPAIDDGKRRAELAAKLAKTEWGREPQGMGSRASLNGAESRMNHTYPSKSHTSAMKKEDPRENQSAREPDEDHLQHDDAFEAWVAAKQAETPNLVPMPGISDRGEDRPPPVARTHPKKIRGTG